MLIIIKILVAHHGQKMEKQCNIKIMCVRVVSQLPQRLRSRVFEIFSSFHRLLWEGPDRKKNPKKLIV